MTEGGAFCRQMRGGRVVFFMIKHVECCCSRPTYLLSARIHCLVTKMQFVRLRESLIPHLFLHTFILKLNTTSLNHLWLILNIKKTCSFIMCFNEFQGGRLDCRLARSGGNCTVRVIFLVELSEFNMFMSCLPWRFVRWECATVMKFLCSLKCPIMIYLFIYLYIYSDADVLLLLKYVFVQGMK